MSLTNRTLRCLSVFPTVRGWLWRIGRTFYMTGRGDVPNDPRHNGEYWLLQHVITLSQIGDRLIDVGANRGDWSAEALRQGADARGCSIDAFEPSDGTRAALCARTRGAAVTVHRTALSDWEGDASFFEVSELAGTNSLHPIHGGREVRVSVTTLDKFLAERGYESIKFIKIDTEGFDLHVLRGGMASLRRGAVEAIQFEYNWRWVCAGSTMWALFELISGTPYRCGKLVEAGIEFYDAWHPELDRFFEGNYVLIRRGSALEALGKSMAFDGANIAVRPGERDK